MPTQPTPLDLTVTYENDGATLSLGGEFDVQNTHRLRAAVQAALAVGSTDLTFDCEHLEFIDSSGLAVVALAVDETRARGGGVTIANASARLVRLLQVTGMDDVVVILP